MNNNVEMKNYNNTRKRKRNWANTYRSPKRMRLNRKTVAFKNTPNRKKLNMSNAMRESRKSILRNTVTLQSPNIEHILSKRTNNKTYRKKLLENLKNQGKLFKD